MEIIFLTPNPKLLQNDNLLDQAQGEPLTHAQRQLHLLMQFTEKYFLLIFEDIFQAFHMQATPHTITTRTCQGALKYYHPCRGCLVLLHGFILHVLAHLQNNRLLTPISLLCALHEDIILSIIEAQKLQPSWYISARNSHDYT